MLPRLKTLADSVRKDHTHRDIFRLARRVDSIYVHQVKIEGVVHSSRRLIRTLWAIDYPAWVTVSNLEGAIRRVCYGAIGPPGLC
jgi:hypothetical protein